MSIYLKLIWAYFKISIFGFGGGYAMLSLIRHEIVDRGWITEHMFTDIVAISQMTPGPIGINSATYIGYTVGGGVMGSMVTTLAVILPYIVHIALLHDGLRRAELTGQAVTLGADVHHLVERALRRGLRAHSHLIGYRPVPSGIGAAGIRRQHTAVRADTDRCQAAAGTVEGLVRQIRMDLLHHLSPQGGRGVHGVADPLVVLVAHPDRRAVIRRVACEITVIVVVGGAGLACDVHPAESSAAAISTVLRP